MILSIITPYYDRLKEIKRLASVLEPQLTNNWVDNFNPNKEDCCNLRR